MKKITPAVFILLLLLPLQNQALTAFPGALGYGAQSVGGRGGNILLVTNTNSDGPGSLRAAIDATGPRVVIFRVSGLIILSEQLTIKNPYITINGQSAPGDGICIRSNGARNLNMVKVETHDVIIRYIRFRRGPSTNGGECSGDNLTLTNADKCIFDHCSFSWSTDEQANGWPATNVTFQWCIFSEALLNSTHSDNCDSAGPLQDHALGPLMGNTSKNITFYANLFAGNVGRNPQFAPTDGGRFQLVNNVIYDACFAVMNNGLNGKVMEINAIGNYIKEGPNSCDEHRNNILFKGDAKGYLKDNLTPYRNDGDPEWNASSEFRTCTPANTAFKADTPFETPALKTYSAVDAYKTVIDSAGANKSINNADLTVNNRDTIDLRAASYTKSGTARVGTKGLRVDSPSEVGGWPSYASATPYVDKDQDGMADAWEDEYGLNSSNGNDHNIDNDNDGYTNIEEFLNGTVPSLPTEIITPVKSGTGTHSKKSTKNYTLQGRRLGNELKKASGIRIEISTNGKMRFTVNHTRY